MNQIVHFSCYYSLSAKSHHVMFGVIIIVSRSALLVLQYFQSEVILAQYHCCYKNFKIKGPKSLKYFVSFLFCPTHLSVIYH